MKLLANMDEVKKLVEWQQEGENRLLKLKFKTGSEIYKVEVSNTATGEKENVDTRKEITISGEKEERVRERNTAKVLKKISGSFYSFHRWMERGNREFHFLVGEGVDAEAVMVFVFDHDLGVGQTVSFYEEIDLLSEKILLLMTLSISEKSEKKKRQYISEIVELERQKLLPQK